MKKFLSITILVLSCFFLQAVVDLNRASLNEIKQLPVTEEQAKDIYDYREFISFFKSIYDLRKIKSIDQKTLLKLKKLVKITHYSDLDKDAARRDEIGYLLERLGNSEGSSEGMNDVWQDFLMSPQNINDMLFEDLISIPNVSKVDAVALLKKRNGGFTYKSVRDVRTAQGIAYYGYSNLKHYILFNNKDIKDKLYVDYQLKVESLDLEEDQLDMYKQPIIRDLYRVLDNDNPEAYAEILNEVRQRKNSFYGYFKLDDYSPQVTNKIRARYGNKFKVGLMHFSDDILDSMSEENKVDLRDDAKFYAGYEDKFKLNKRDDGTYFVKAYAGNYRATFGEGLVMENSDYYSPRKTGEGFSKRIMGITPDLSKSQTTALRGGAVELKNKWFNSSFFYSTQKKDALVYMTKEVDEDGNVHSVPMVDENGKYRVFSYINPSIRFDNDDLAAAEVYFNNELGIKETTFQGNQAGYDIDYLNLSPRKNFVNENIFGTHLQVNPMIGTRIGFTTYTATYDNANFIVPKGADLTSLLFRDSSNYNKWKQQNSIIEGLYSTKTDKYDRDYRRVIGFDGGTVINNLAIDGEYAELTKDGKDAVIGDDPKAYLIKAYTQYNNFSFLTLYRHTDIDFDNPYSNSFAEQHKFDDTAFEKYGYALTNPLMADIYANSSQAQAEQGFYFETRYQILTDIIFGRTYLDIFERLCDHRNTVRFQGEIQYKAFHQLRFKLKYKNQVNRYQDDAERGVSKTQEYTLSARMLLSNRDYLDIEYRYNTVDSPPYTSLTNTADEGENTQSDSMTRMNGDYIATNYTHYFTPKFKVKGSFCVWNGYDISHWDWEDVELDFMGDRGYKYWFTIQDNISENLYLAFKFKHKVYRTQELFVRHYNVTNDQAMMHVPVYYDRVEKQSDSFRLQLEYHF